MCSELQAGVEGKTTLYTDGFGDMECEWACLFGSASQSINVLKAFVLVYFFLYFSFHNVL